MSAFGTKLRKLEAGRIAFWCPGCNAAHQINVFDDPLRQGPLWEYNGNVDAPTFRPSIFVNPPGRLKNPGADMCHSFVTDGRIQFLGDSTHWLAGQTVALPDWPGWGGL